MENNKTKIQKIIIVVALIVSVCVLVSSFVFVNSNWQSLRAVGQRTAFNQNTFYWNALDGESPSGKDNLYYYDFWMNLQSANNSIFYLSIIGLVSIAVACIAGNFSRRKYYISNLVCGLIYPITTIIGSIIAFVKLVVLKAEFGTCTDDFQVYYDAQIAKQEKYDLSTDGITKISGDSIAFYYVILVIAIVCACAFAYITIHKFLKTYPNFNKDKDVELNNNTFAEEK